MTASSRVLTIILNYRTAEMTLRSCARARIAMEHIDGEILIVDNDSGDGSFETMKDHVAQENWTDVRVVQSGHNGGFGAGNNFGIRTGMTDGSKPDFVYVLNSDAFPEPDAIVKLRDHMTAHADVGFVGSTVFGEDGERHMTVFRFPSVLSELEYAARLGVFSKLLVRFKVPVEQPSEIASVDWLAGASMMMRFDMLEEIGLFDESYFLYFEETDLFLRAHRAGFQAVFVPESRVMHIGSVSTGMGRWTRIPQYWLDSRLYYFAKNHGAGAAMLSTIAHLVGGILHRLRMGIVGKRPEDPPFYLWDMVRHDLRAAFRRPKSPQIPNPLS